MYNLNGGQGGMASYDDIPSYGGLMDSDFSGFNSGQFDTPMSLTGLTDEQMKAMVEFKRKEQMAAESRQAAQKFGMAGMNAPQIPQERATPLQGLMSMVGQGQVQNQRAAGQRRPQFENQYVKGLMG